MTKARRHISKEKRRMNLNEAEALLRTAEINTRVDDIPSKTDLRAKAEEKAEASLLNPVPPGAVVRTDQGDEKPELSEELRLGFAKAILPKIESSDPATAERLINAAKALLPPIARSDDDDTKSPISGKSGKEPPAPQKPGDSPLNQKDDDPDNDGKPRKAPDVDDDTPPWAAKLIDTVTGFGERLDALEAKKPDDDDDTGIGEVHDDNGPDEPKDGAARRLAADQDASFRKNSMILRTKKDRLNDLTLDPRTQDLFAKVQSRADSVYAMFGGSAPRSMHSESLGNYRRRLLMPFQKHSKSFRNSDLRVVQVDSVAFDAVEDEVYKCAADAIRDPASVPVGHLREIVESKNGHTYTRFVGRPSAWMNQFSGRTRLVKNITVRSDDQKDRVHEFSRPITR
jgi:hypothetical protein